jgi:hypothetical protein
VKRSSFVAFAALALLGTVWNAEAQSKWALEDQPFYLPFRAEPRAAQINITALAYSEEFPFLQEAGTRQVWDITLGKELPIFGRFTGVGDPELSPGDWWWGVFLPVGFHMVEDFKDPSAPIINTDYRFGASLKYMRGLDNRWSLGFKFEPFGHESTHLGDEYSLAGRTQHEDFFRVNVSYEFWDVAFHAAKERDASAWRLQGGVVGLWGDDGFYSYDLSETGERELTPSKSTLEPYLSLERLPRRGWLGSWSWFLSLDLRHRIVYRYFRESADEREDRQLSLNLMLGLMHAERTFGQRGITDFFLRFYHGVNPHGQFRSEKDYFLIGVGLHVDI